MAHNLIQSGIKQLEINDFSDGVKAVLTGGQPKVSYEEAGRILDELFSSLQQEQAADQAEIAAAMKKEGEEFLRANASAEGVKVLSSGLQYKVLKSGGGKKPGRNSKVRCHYEGRFVSGHIFDSSYKRGEPAVFGVSQVIAGWTEALQLMCEGDEWELYIPYNLGYGEAGAGSAIPPCAALIFKVELLEVI